jgi:hypothetical protein
LANPKVTYDLKETIFKFDKGDTTFYFMRKLTMNKFRKGYLENRKKIKMKLQNLYLISVDLDDYADMYYYHVCQRNGFRVVRGGEEITCLNDIILDGQIKMKRI